MRLNISRIVLALSLATSSFAAIAPEGARPANVEEDVLGNKPVIANAAAPTLIHDEDPTLDASTTFNGIAVPPLKELDGIKFNDQTKEGYWYALPRYSLYGLVEVRQSARSGNADTMD